MPASYGTVWIWMSQIGLHHAKVVRSPRSHVIIDRFLVSLLNPRRGSTTYIYRHSRPLPYPTVLNICWPASIGSRELSPMLSSAGGTPATITTDKGAQFESKLWDNLCNKFGIIWNREWVSECIVCYGKRSSGLIQAPSSLYNTLGGLLIN